MLALDRRRHTPFPDHPSPLPQLSHLTYFDHLSHTQVTPSPSSDCNRRPLGYFDASSSIDSSSIPSTFDSSMQDSYSFSNPTVRIQQPTPTPSLDLPQSLSDPSAYNQWVFGNNSQMAAATRSLQSASALQPNRTHRRAQSSSSMSSNSPASPFSQGHAPYGYNLHDSSPVAKLGQSNLSQYDQSSNSFSHHLPTPTQTPTQDSFLSANYPSPYSQGGDINGVLAASFAMNNQLETRSNAEEDVPGMSHSSRQSVSSIGQDPSTPRTNPDGYEASLNDQPQRLIPKLDRTVSDAYNDALYSSVNLQPQPASSSTKSKQVASPHRNIINEYLQVAHAQRGNSPTITATRGISPFRPSSPYVQTAYNTMQRPFTAASVRQAQQACASQMELSQHLTPQQEEQIKTISPKDAMLEYHESEDDSKVPLFSEAEAAAYNSSFTDSGSQAQQSLSPAVENAGLPKQVPEWSNNSRRRSQQQTPSATSSSFNFATPAVSSNFSGLPFSSQNYRAVPITTKQESTPEFPAMPSLISMESSASEAPQSSQASSNTVETTKPFSSAADSGTYTCTYHGCSLRFETPQKLQKHKREAHRTSATASPSSMTATTSTATPSTPGLGSGMTSAQLAQRNSQSGPHKCERINPTTGKPCNTIFSRPYDLTRHEDTIHNIRKTKVRCALCVEEKTFSRNDALTRHMRVVHPEVDFPGKHRRRGHD